MVAYRWGAALFYFCTARVSIYRSCWQRNRRACLPSQRANLSMLPFSVHSSCCHSRSTLALLLSRRWCVWGVPSACMGLNFGVVRLRLVVFPSLSSGVSDTSVECGMCGTATSPQSTTKPVPRTVPCFLLPQEKKYGESVLYDLVLVEKEGKKRKKASR